MNDMIETGNPPSHAPVQAPEPTREDVIQLLRRANVSDARIAEFFNISRQRIHAMLGPRPEPFEGYKPPDKMPPLEELPAFIKQWRTRRGLSMAQAARMIGVGTMTWCNWETGHTGCSLGFLLMHYLTLVDKIETISALKL